MIEFLLLPYTVLLWAIKYIIAIMGWFGVAITIHYLWTTRLSELKSYRMRNPFHRID